MRTLKILVALFMFAAWTNAHAVDATITFTDTSTSEAGFTIRRNLNGGPFIDLAPVKASLGSGSTVQVIDTTLVASPTIDNKYCYTGFAFNTAGNSAFAVTATPGVTDCKIVPMIVTIPSGPTGLLVQ